MREAAARRGASTDDALSRLPTPPNAGGLPLLGQALNVARDPEAALRQMYRRHGPIFQFDVAHFNYICLAGPEANEFLNNDGKDCISSLHFWRSITEELNSPNLVLALDGERHRTVRQVLKPAMARNVVEENIADIVGIVKSAFDAYATGAMLPFVFLNQKITSNIVGHLMMATTPTDDELRRFFDYADAVTVTLAALRLPRAALRLRGRAFRRAKALTRDLSERVVARAISEPHDRRLIVDTVLEARKKFPELFTEGDVNALGFMAFFLGIDTLGQTTTFMIWELLRHPELLQRVQREVDDVFGAHGGIPTVDDLKQNLPCLHGAFLETMRLHPTAFGLVRGASRDFEFAGHRVPANRHLLFYTTMCHKLDQYFPNAKTFDIDRGLPERNEYAQRGVYAPFGRGPHKCLGAGWADAQALLTVGTILYHYELELPANMRDIRPRLRTTPTLGPKFTVRLKNRRHR